MRVFDQVNSIYRGVFSIKFKHESYSAVNTNVISDAIRVIPDLQTQELFASRKMLYRFHSDLLTCFIQCNIIPVPGDEPKSKPLINFTAEDIRMRFLVKASTGFLKKTNIVAAGAREIYQLNNKNNASINMVITAEADGVNAADLKPIEQVEPGEPCLAVIDIHTDIADDEYRMFDNKFLLVDNMPEYKIIFKKAM